MGMQCTTCGSEHIQSIKAILQTGTTYSSGSVTGVGVSTEGAGTFSGSSNGVSYTALAARFTPPKKPKKLEMIAGSLLVLATSPWLFSKTPLAFICLALMAWLAWEVRAYLKRDKKYQHDYPIWKRLYASGFYCNRCSNVFTMK